MTHAVATLLPGCGWGGMASLRHDDFVLLHKHGFMVSCSDDFVLSTVFHLLLVCDLHANHVT